MAAVNPGCVGNGFDQGSLELVIDTIRTQGNSLLELINHNVSGQQYVVAGHHAMLSALGQVLDTIYACMINVASDYGRDDVANIIHGILAQGTRDITPKRGHSLIPLPGIDVPSHSTQLLPAVASFRRYLLDKLHEDGVNYDELKHIYIPNVTARPFEVSKEYLEDVFSITRSPVLAVELSRWDDIQDMPRPRLTKLARIILVELLAYQFASPVRWIETQDTLFRLSPVRRFIEIGSVPTLTRMAERTLEIQKYKRVNVAILHAIQDELELTYSYTPESNEVSSDEVELLGIPETETIQHAPKVAASAPSPITIPSAAQAITDAPVKTLDIVQALIELKMKRTASGISTSKTIKELSSGKSTLQNEIASELQKEFSSKIPDKAEEMSLSDLAAKIGVFNGTFGKQISSHLARMFATKIPSNYTQSALRSHLEAAYGLGPQRCLGILLLALTMEPPSRLQSDTEVDGWIRNVAEMYGRREGIAYITDHSPGGGAAAGLANATINSAEFVKAQDEQRAHILCQVEVLAC
ncbi:hypothetical protein DL89DRAFT_261539 [Linderina pennispora]|uniref:Fatty acid synthase subunit alpha acyl carrier domain-containing protein n=1 Tax=Linderina pennispora TaxID=61395 RepID=A0A1Y1VUW6_9FUNG|nr:uncharacterized protein DL89DRAFT_261539 [Linderina pennispora]ORX65080.1 hypothetical protein DL89DRAFT_261539 [Linderina pennispora]